MGGRFQLSSGRVIALGRLLLAVLFLFAIWIELGHPSEAPFQSFVLAVGYLFFSAAILLATWNDWWLDATLAGAAHTLDIAMFTLMVLLTHGYTSPFFTFFVFLLLSSAIRWGWRATSLTAALVAVLYLVAGLLVGGVSAGFDVQHFVVRTGHLIIMSLILIWFGVNQWRSQLPPAIDPMLDPSVPDSPLEGMLRNAAGSLRAASAIVIWRDRETARLTVVRIRGGAFDPVGAKQLDLPASLPDSAFLYDLQRDRVLTRDSERNLTRLPTEDVVLPETAKSLTLQEGLAIPVRTEAGQGMVFAEGLPGLSIDHLNLAEQVAATAAAQLQRRALVRAAEERAAGRSRVALARDLHDSVVQFLAGAAFRLEALKRGAAAGGDLTGEIEALKQLMMHEQGELRAFIAALRSGTRVDYASVATDLKILAERLGKNWSVNCDFSSEPGHTLIPARLQLDAQGLIREAVANAVRHAGAKNIEIRLSADAGIVRLQFINDGAAYPKSRNGGRMPQSLRERVEEVGGTIELSRGMGVTRVSISLPVPGAGA